jgi:UDP-N-acetylmuramoyl-L-alanyl-D-glutamate--2,6-diaminopimelate ligase
LRLDRLAAAIGCRVDRRDGGLQIVAIALDSRQAVNGSLFVAIAGTRVDGHEFIPAAIAAGAVAVVAERRSDCPRGVVGLVVSDSRAALAQLARCFYGCPDDRLGLIGVTGTDGKTTTCSLLAHLIAGAGAGCGLITTAQLGVGGVISPRAEHETTPSALRVNQLLAEMVAAGDHWAVIEATSHALDQKRVDGLGFDVAVYTRITHEHLEYHRTIDAYVAAKARLAQLVDEAGNRDGPGTLVLNAADPHSAAISAGRRCRQLSYGQGVGDVQSRRVCSSVRGLEFEVLTPWGTGVLQTPLRGRFNIDNVLAAIAAGGAAGFELDALIDACRSFGGVAGRMQYVDCGQDFAIVVDYAHTPASLGAVLAELRNQSDGRIIAVFGSAGERDIEKRFLMGRVAAGLADLAVITDEDPRGEDRDLIAAQIVAGLRQEDPTANFVVIHDRPQAVGYAVAQARPGDVVALLGKGHENSIIGPSGEAPYDEVEAARQALASLA